MAGGEDNNQQPRQPRDMQVSQSCCQEIKWQLGSGGHREISFILADWPIAPSCMSPKAGVWGVRAYMEPK